MVEKLDKILSPLADKLGRQRHLQAISDGMMMSLALIVVGSLFLIVANPPVNLDLVDLNTSNIFLKALICWKQWAVANYSLYNDTGINWYGDFFWCCLFISSKISNEYSH